jgi:extracellular elastinolytic metalloproteinase
MQYNRYLAAVAADPPYATLFVADSAADSSYKTIVKRGPLASYKVLRWGVPNLQKGVRSLVRPEPDLIASPAGWHAVPKGLDPRLQFMYNAKPLSDPDEWLHTTTTLGNNAVAQDAWNARDKSILQKHRPDGGSELVFEFEYAPEQHLSAESSKVAEVNKYIDASITQAFYMANMAHDLFYRYGFDEVAGNFQQHNFGRGGRENDGIIIDVQTGGGFNNGLFDAPADGENGRMFLFLYRQTDPFRDSVFDSGIVIHELTHGLSSRLVGGPAGFGCLNSREALGMSEGWSGAFIIHPTCYTEKMMLRRRLCRDARWLYAGSP